jgi:integrase
VGYEAYVEATGQEPPTVARKTGRTFREIADACKQRGGPKKARWKAGRDQSVLQRLEYAVDFLGDLDIAAVSTPDLDRLVNSLARRPGKAKGDKRLSAGTINRYLTAVSSVLTFAVERGYINAAPVVPWQEEGKGREAVLSEAGEEAVMRWMQDHGHYAEAIAVEVLAATGLRLGEFQVIAEHPEQIGHEWLALRADQTKTNRPRTVWIEPALADKYRALATSGRVPKGHRLRKVFHAACKACGQPAELVLHSLRHTRATRLLQHGADPQVTMEMMGWTSFSVMQRYRHVNQDMQREVAKKVAHARGKTDQSAEIFFGPFRNPHKFGQSFKCPCTWVREHLYQHLRDA